MYFEAVTKAAFVTAVKVSFEQCWTIEVKFDADSDDLLGVHNNKQGIEFVRTEDTDPHDEFNPHIATLQQARQRCWVELTKRIKAAKDAVWKQVRDQGRE